MKTQCDRCNQVWEDRVVGDICYKFKDNGMNCNGTLGAYVVPEDTKSTQKESK